MKIKTYLIGKYRSTELGKKILAILLSVSFLQISMVMFISYHLSTSIITEQTRELIDGNLEQEEKEIPVEGEGIRMEFRPFEIKTVKLRLR